MHKALLASTLLASLPVVGQAQTANLNLGSVSADGGPSAFNSHLDFGGYETNLPTGETEHYTPANVSTDGNSITLSANPDGTSGAITSGTEVNGMPTAGGFSMTNGTLDITATMPAGANTWPALWMEPVNTTAIPAGVSCEQDLIEAPFNDPNKYQATSHGGAGGQFVVAVNNLANPHTYGITITPSTITFLLDGNAVGTVPNSPACANQPMMLLANVAIGGWASGYANGQSTLPAAMKISKITYTGDSATGGLIGRTTATTVPSAAAAPLQTVTGPAGQTAGSAATPLSGAAKGAVTAAVTAASPSAATPTTQIKPGGSTVKDCSGNTWAITADNRITENGNLVPGGGDTSALTMDGSCTVYGLSNGNNGSKTGWFTLSSVTPGAGQVWNYMGATAAPPMTSGTATTPTTAPGTSAKTGPTPAVSIPPLAVQSCPTGSTAATGGFHVAGGQIIGPDGKAWVARGIDIHDNTAQSVSGMQAITAAYPGVNLLRVAIESLGDDPASFASAVDAMTSEGRVVQFSDYTNTTGNNVGGSDGRVYTGAQLAQESAMYAAFASYYKANPYVWFGTDNEPATSGGSLSDWHAATYQAVRGTGNNSIILIDPSGSRPIGYGGTPEMSGLNPGTYASMTNIVWDPHIYSYQDNNATDQGTADAEVKAMVQSVQTIQSADGVVPAIVGEYGPANNPPDAADTATITAVINAGTNGVDAGSAAWAWDTGAANLNLQQNQTWGQMVALYANTNVVPPTKCQQTAAAQQTINTNTAAQQQTSATPSTTTTDQTAASGNAAAAALTQQGDATMAQATAIAAQTATQASGP